MKHFSLVFFIHHNKTVIKVDQTSSFYLLSLYQCYIVLKISKEGKCHHDMSFHLKLQKHINQTREYLFLKTLPVSSFALAFPVYIRLVVNNHALQCVRVDLSKTKFRIVADKPLLSCDLDVYIQLLGWIVLINYFDTRHTTVFDQFECFSIGLMHHHQWSKSRCSVRLARLDLSARVCGRFWSRKWSKRTEKKPTLHYKSIRKKFTKVAR